jgi:drug/metabolite transporter (DMT)-like permease
VRFSLGAAALLPLALITYRRGAFTSSLMPRSFAGQYLSGGGIAGVALFAGASLQQVGLVFTTAGNAGFITGLYVVFVPMMGLFWGQCTNAGTWIGALLAVVGLYLLSVEQGLQISRGDLFVLCGAVAWAAHTHILARIAPGSDPLMLAVVQFSICALLSWVTALGIEAVRWSGIHAAAIPILYGGLLSVGVAYTLQVVAQRRAHPAHAAIFLSLEAVFAAIGGWLILDELLTPRALGGCALMFCAMLLSQLYSYFEAKKHPSGAVPEYPESR